jgi:hypothetical protein
LLAALKAFKESISHVTEQFVEKDNYFRNEKLEKALDNLSWHDDAQIIVPKLDELQKQLQDGIFNEFAKQENLLQQNEPFYLKQYELHTYAIELIEERINQFKRLIETKDYGLRRKFFSWFLKTTDRFSLGVIRPPRHKTAQIKSCLLLADAALYAAPSAPPHCSNT